MTGLALFIYSYVRKEPKNAQNSYETNEKEPRRNKDSDADFMSGNLLRDDEYLRNNTRFSYVDAAGNENSLDLAAGSLAFTYCQVPIVYTRGSEASILVQYADGREETIPGNSLSIEISALVFARSSKVVRIDVQVPA